jgi:IclR family pca regulon transcriptional regulator
MKRPSSSEQAAPATELHTAPAPEVAAVALAKRNATERLPVEEIAGHRGDPDFMSSLARGLAVLSAFDEHDRSLNIAQISMKTGIPRAAVRRCLYTLGSLGYVGPGPQFQLRAKVLTLGHAQLVSTPLAAAAQPWLDRCRDHLHESCSLGVLDHDDVYYLARSETTRIMSIALQVGSRLPAYCTSMGRVLLAHVKPDEFEAYLARARFEALTARTVTAPDKLRAIIDGVRRSQYAIVDQELELGLRSIAVPVLDAKGQVVAALNTGTQSARMPIKELTQRCLPELRAAAAELTRVLS